MERFWLEFLALELIVVLQGVFSHFNKTWSMSQMNESGYETGLPFNKHAGMWLDLLVISALIAYLNSKYNSQWSVLTLAVVCGISFPATVAFHWVTYVPGTAGCHVNKGRITIAGWLHVIYMSWGIAVLWMFYWHTANVDTLTASIVSLVVFAHWLAAAAGPKYVARQKIWTKVTLVQASVVVMLITVGFVNIIS